MLCKKDALKAKSENCLLFLLHCAGPNSKAEFVIKICDSLKCKL